MEHGRHVLLQRAYREHLDLALKQRTYLAAPPSTYEEGPGSLIGAPVLSLASIHRAAQKAYTLGLLVNEGQLDSGPVVRAPGLRKTDPTDPAAPRLHP